MARFKLSVVSDDGKPLGDIGEFSDTTELMNWASDNSGALEDYEDQETK